MPRPTDIRFQRKSRRLVVTFDDGAEFELPCEYLRVFSPSAEVRGHGVGEGALVMGKEDVTVTRIEPVGNYAVRLYFSDGHSTGLFSWQVLYELGTHRDKSWARYLERLGEAGVKRREDENG